MLRREMRPVRWTGLWLLLILLAAAGWVPAQAAPGHAQAEGAPTAAPAGAPLAVRGGVALVTGGYTVEGQEGLHVESRILSLPPRQASVVYISAPVQAPLPFTDVAPSWDTPPPAGDTPAAPDSIRVEIRTGPDGQAWTDWQPTDQEDIVDPREPLTRTYASLVGVPQDVRTHRFAQLRVTLSATEGTPRPQLANLTLNFVDAGVTTEVPVATVFGGTPPVKPPVISRRAWGSPEPTSSPRWAPEYRRVTHVIVHHTETTNNDGDYAARVRAIWYFHTFTRGWGDIGYNYLIDPRGNVYEGRYGGDDVVAGHAYPFNYGSLGVSLIGNYDAVAPSSALRDSLIKLLAWAVDRRRIDPQGVSTFTGALTCGGSVRLTRPNIAGHRDFRGTGCGREFNAKTCPGTYAYALLPTIRAALGMGLPPYRAVFESHTTPQTMAPGSIITATVVVRNGGSLTWPQAGPNPVRLGYHWYTLDGARLTAGYPDVRTPLRQDVGYGTAVTLAAHVGAPVTPGTYELRWDLVHELVTWFADKGSATLNLRVTVAAQDATPPAARVLPLDPYQGAADFTVYWSGADDPGGSGLLNYDVQYRVGAGGPWINWQTATPATSAPFAGADGYTYAFRARARDRAGNVGPYVAVGDTVTTVALAPPRLEILVPAPGQRVSPGPLSFVGQTDAGALARVNGVDVPVGKDGTFGATVQAPAGGDFPILVEVQSLSGKVARDTVVVHVGGRFRDVPPAYWAFDAIEFLSALNVISGYDDGTFRPGGSITRAQYMKMLAGAFRWAAARPTRARFGDVPLEYWASSYIEAAVAKDLISGYDDGSFRPGSEVTRAQVAKVLVLAAGWRLLGAADSPFSDVPITHWAYLYVETAYRHGVIQDTLGGRFRPDAPASRAEVAVMLYYTLGDLAAAGTWP